MNELLRFLRSFGPGGPPLVLATVVRVEGHAFRQPGARMLLDAGGPVAGTVSGGCLEGEVASRAREVLADGRPQVHTYDLRGDLDLVWGTGAGCEGATTILVERLDLDAPWLAEVEATLARRERGRLATTFEGSRMGQRRWLAEGEEGEPGTLVEVLQPPIALWVYGAGDEARPLVRLAQGLGWRVGMLDHRPAFARPSRFPEAEEVRSGHPRQVIPGLPEDPRTAWVLMSHVYAKDQEALRLLLPSAAGYVGLLGHRARGARMLAELRAEGLPLSSAQLARFHTPVGLDLGGTDPAALALSVASEIQAVLEGGSGLPLREGRGACLGVLP
jgi:xanthine/CO dehydrogenase XdhC/CoxF family maturation factor